MSTITTRSGKGAPLTNNEVDSNFTNLNTDKAELSGATFTGDVKLGDNDKATFGAGSDLQIFHNGTESFIREVGEGGLKIDSNGPEITLRVNATENALMAESNGAVTVYYNNVAKLATTATGINVTGTATMDGLVVNTTNGVSVFESTGISSVGLQFKTNGTNRYQLQIPNLSADLAFLAGGTTKALNLAANGDISFYEDTGTTAKLFWDASAEFLGIGTTTSTVNGESLRLVNGLYLNGGGTKDVPAIGLGDTNSGLFGSTYVAVTTQGQERFRVDTGGNVGIGISNPATLSHISSGYVAPTGGVDANIKSLISNASSGAQYVGLGLLSGNNGGSFIHFGDTDDMDVGAISYFHDNNRMQFSTNGSERMRIDNAGKVGIGTDSPTFTLEVNGGGAADNLKVESQSTLTNFYQTTTGGTTVFQNNNGNMAMFTGGAERMRIDSAGNVGIGTNSPNTKLHIQGDGLTLKLDGTANTTRQIMLRNTGTAEGQIQTDGNMHFIQEDANKYMRFSTANTERMRIDGSGNLLVGTTDNNVYNDATGTGTVIQSNGIMQLAANSGTPLYANRQGTDGEIVSFRKDGEPVGSIGAKSSDLYIGTGDTGLAFYDYSTENAILPHNPATNLFTDASIDLGRGTSGSAYRFKDLYLSGTATMDGLTVDGKGILNTNYSFGQSNYHLKMGEDSGDSYLGNVNGSAFLATGNYYGSNQYTLTNGATALSGVYLDGSSGIQLFSEAGLTANSTVTRKQRLKVAPNGDISFYEDTGTTAKLFWDASAESLGIGTSSPTAALDLGNGDLRFTGGAGQDIVWGSASTDYAAIRRIDPAAQDVGLAFHTTTNAGSDGAPERMRIDSAGNVGIGCSPNTLMEIASTSPVLRITNTTSSVWSAGDDIGRLSFYSTDPSAVGPHETAFILNESDFGSNITQLSGALSFGTAAYNAAATERMRIDSAGNLLMGKTTTNYANVGAELKADGKVYSTVSGGTSLVLNRKTNDGDIISLYKDNASVGSIGSIAGQYLSIGTGDTGLAFDDDENHIIPWNTSTNGSTNGSVDLGDGARRFKDLYLSGGVYLGGTGAANKLDDYEEGTFTPAITFGGAAVGLTYSVTRGSYTKVGNLVTIQIGIDVNSKGTSSGVMQITGLPFASATITGGYSASIGSMRVDGGWTGLTGAVLPYVNESGATSIVIRQGTSTGTIAVTEANITSGYLFLSATYFTG